MSGKTTLLRETYPESLWIDLLKSEQFRRYTEKPEILREELEFYKKKPFVVIDEIQKIPALLNEVHWLIENRNIKFALSGSSARKVKRGHANLLGGRALRYELRGLVSGELGEAFELSKVLNHGNLPSHYVSDKYKQKLNAYISDYLKEEVAAEGLVRNLQIFSHFLTTAVLSDTEIVNFSNIARECGVSSHTTKEHFEILVDCLLGQWLPSYRKRPKRRVIDASKFYFSNVGVVNFLAKRPWLEPGTELYGKAFENWIFHELNSYKAYQENFTDLFYWRLASGIEVDFIVGDMEVAIEAKASKKILPDHLRGLRSLKEDHPHIKKRMIVCHEAKARKTEDGIEIVPYQMFCEDLWSGSIF